jgi:hypothetical protein
MNVFYYITIIFLLFLLNNNFASAEYIINIDNSRKNLKSIKINNIDFVEFEQLIKLFNNSVKYNKDMQLVYIDNFSVVVQPNNFFVFFKNTKAENNFEKIIQLSIPTIERENIIYLPIKSFILGLNSLINFNFDIISDKIFIETNDSLLDFFGKKQKEIPIIVENELIENKEFAEKLIEKIEKVEENEEIAEKIIENTKAEEIEKVENPEVKNFEINQFEINEKIKLNYLFPEVKMNFDFEEFAFVPELIELKVIEIKEVTTENEVLKNEIIKPKEITKIIKKDISDLEFNQTFNDKNSLNENLQNEKVEEKIKLEEFKFEKTEKKLEKIQELNDSFPPFRKYSIPDSLIKKKLEEL